MSRLAYLYVYLYLTLVFVSIGKRWALGSKAWNFWTGVRQGSQGKDEDDLEKIFLFCETFLSPSIKDSGNLNWLDLDVLN